MFGGWGENDADSFWWNDYSSAPLTEDGAEEYHRGLLTLLRKKGPGLGAAAVWVNYRQKAEGTASSYRRGLAAVRVGMNGVGGRFWATTDSNGVAHFGGVPPGTYSVSGGMGSIPMHDVAIEPGACRAEAITLKSATIEGTVRDSDGVPEAGEDVQLLTLSGKLVSTFSDTRTKGDGSFRMEGVGPGQYLVAVGRDARFYGFYPNAAGMQQAARITVRAGGVVRDVNIDLPPEPDDDEP